MMKRVLTSAHSKKSLHSLADGVKNILDESDAVTNICVATDARHDAQVVADDLADGLDEHLVFDAVNQPTKELDAEFARRRVDQL